MAKVDDLENMLYYIGGGLGIASLVILIIALTLVYYVYALRKKVKKLSLSVDKLKVFRSKPQEDESFQEAETPYKEQFGWQNSEAPGPSAHQQLQHNLKQSFQNRNLGFQQDEPQSPHQQQPWRLDEPREIKRPDSHIPRVLPPYQGPRNPLSSIAQPRNNMPQARPYGNQQHTRGGY